MGKAESLPRVLLLTGVPGVGKTTLIRNLARDLPGKVQAWLRQRQVDNR